MTGMVQIIPFYWQAAMVFLVGLAVGSFANVCIHRLPRGESVVSPRSRCPKCGNAVLAADNIPVLSWLILRGKCRHCSAPISIIYPLVELVTAVLVTVLFFKYGPSVEFAVYFILAPALVIINLVDLEHQIIPDRITLPGIVYGAACGFYLHGLADTALGFLIGGGLFYGLGELWWRLYEKEGMGGGDIKYMAAVGALLGWKLTLLNIFMASLAGAVVGVALIAMGRKEWSDKIPYGVYLTAGTYLAITCGDALVNWYLRSIVGM